MTPLLFVLPLLGCAPKAPLATDGPAAAIRTAEEVGAREVPQASLHLQLAQESFDRARELYDDGDADEAASMLLRSEADAELAVVLARAEAERTQAQEAIQRVHRFRTQNPSPRTP